IPGSAHHRPAKSGPVRHERVELTTLTAWIDARGQIGKECRIELASGEAFVELGGIDADQTRLESSVDEPLRELRGIEPPYWEAGLKTGSLQQSLAIRADVGQKKVAERDVSDIGARFSDRLQRVVKRSFVRLIGAILLEQDFLERKSQALCLCMQQRPPHTMDTDAIVAARHTGEKTDDLELAAVAQRLQRQRTVLAAAPAQKNRLRSFHQYTT